MSETKSDKEIIECPYDRCGRKITQEVLNLMEEGEDYCECEKAERIIELGNELKSSRQQTAQEIDKVIKKHLDLDYPNNKRRKHNGLFVKTKCSSFIREYKELKKKYLESVEPRHSEKDRVEGKK